MVVKYFRCFSWTNFHHLSCDHYHHRFFSLCSWSTPRFSLTQTAPAYLLIHCIGLGHQWSVACFNIKIGISVMSLPECTASLIKSASNHPSNLSSSFSTVCSLMSHFLKQSFNCFLCFFPPSSCYPCDSLENVNCFFDAGQNIKNVCWWYYTFQSKKVDGLLNMLNMFNFNNKDMKSKTSRKSMTSLRCL